MDFTDHNSNLLNSLPLRTTAMRPESKKLSNVIHVYSYNVLSDSFADTNRKFKNCTSMLENRSKRIKWVQAKIDEQLVSVSIFCLQEVSASSVMQWKSFFGKRNYKVLFNTHQDTGELVAFSKLSYKVIKSEGDESVGKINLKCPDRAKLRPSYYVFAMLQMLNTSLTFCIGSCHVPLVRGKRGKNQYQIDSDREMFVSFVLNSFKKFRGFYEGILAGDFNIQMNSPAYKRITRSGKVFPNGCVKTNVNEDIGYGEKEFGPMVNSYEVTGQPRRPTSLGRKKFLVLDYIFCSDNIDVLSTTDLPDISFPHCPHKSQPSDHLLIGAVLRIPSRKTVVEDLPKSSVKLVLEHTRKNEKNSNEAKKQVGELKKKKGKEKKKKMCKPCYMKLKMVCSCEG